MAVETKRPMDAAAARLKTRDSAKTPRSNGSADVLVLAAFFGQVDAMQLAIDRGVGVNAAGKDGVTALMSAAEGGSMAAVKFLVGRRADVNAVDWDGKTALVYAVEEGHLDAMRFLAGRSADVNAADKDGVTALMCAVARGDMRAVELLVRRGADVNAVDNCGVTALMCAVERSDVKAVEFLVRRGADVNAVSSDGETALMCAAEGGDMGLVRYLIDHGADPNSVSAAGQSAAFFAASRGHTAIQRLLTPLLQADNQGGHREGTSQSSASWIISPFDIELLSLIDRQDDGGVQFQAKWMDADVAVQLFIPSASKASFAAEVAVWHQLRHPNVLRLYGACDFRHFFFVFELASNGPVVEYLTACRRSGVKGTPWKFLYEAALGLAYMHERGVVHGDLRASNILVGDDGVAKLAGFSQSVSTRARGSTDSTTGSTTGVFGSTRWQAPERMLGGEATFASDVYSLGLCVVEVVTGETPWVGMSDSAVMALKNKWDPATDALKASAPGPLGGSVGDLVRRLCARDPSQRVTAAWMLERLATEEAAGSQPEPDEQVSIEDYRGGALRRLWDKMQAALVESSVPNLQRCVDEEAQHLYEQLGRTDQAKSLLERFHELLLSIKDMTQSRSHHQRAQRSLPSEAIVLAMGDIRRRLDEMWATVAVSQPGHKPDEWQWREQRAKLLDAFVTEVEQTVLDSDKLETEVDRAELLALLKSERSVHMSSYTPSQLSVINQAYDRLAQQQQQQQDDTMPSAVTTIPECFIPAYELDFDDWRIIGNGGFASVYLARWLGSSVVVKQMLSAIENRDSSPPSWASDSSSRDSDPSDQVDQEERETIDPAVREMFAREVRIWSALSHPHVIRLFGACHIERLVFVCEFTSNGSLDIYLRTHPEEQWQKLYEAALGVQYFHARGIVHGDLKCNNILVGADGKAKMSDFGLSLEAAMVDKSSVQVSGGHWMAPECLAHGASRLSYASDVYSLGMCVIEALRIVDGHNSIPLPWGHLDYRVVKYHVVRKQALPHRPSICTDEQWTLVTRMCAFDESCRLSIGAVVDILGRLAGVDKSSESTAEEKGTIAVAVGLEGVSAVVAAMKSCIDAEQDTGPSNRKTLVHIFGLLWSRLDNLCRVLDAGDCDDVGRLWEFVERSRRSTRAMLGADGSESLIAFTETAMRGYALHRGLDKLVEVNAWPDLMDGGGGCVHDWQRRCNEFLGFVRAETPGVSELVETVEDVKLVNDEMEEKTEL